MPKSEEGIIAVITGSRLVFSALIGCIFGPMIYFLNSMVTDHFTVGGLVASMAIGFGAVYVVRFSLDAFSRGFSTGIFGMGRQRTANELRLDELTTQIEAADRRGDDKEAVNLRKILFNEQLAPHPAALAFEIAQIYEQKLHRAIDATYWYRKCITANNSNNSYIQPAQEGIERTRAQAQSSPETMKKHESEIMQAIADKQYEQAVKLIDGLKNMQAPEYKIKFYAGMVAARQGHYNIAIADLEQVVAERPDHERAAFELAVVLSNGNQNVLARRAWQQYLEKFGDDHPNNAALAREALERLNRDMAVDLEVMREGE